MMEFDSEGRLIPDICGGEFLRRQAKFLRKIKDDPWEAITHDKKVRDFICLLRSRCESPVLEVSQDAKKILTKVGLSALIPNKARKKRTKNAGLLYFQSEGCQELLLGYVRAIMNQLESNPERKVIEWFCDYWDVTPPSKTPKFYGGRHKTKRNTALAIVAYISENPF